MPDEMTVMICFHAIFKSLSFGLKMTPLKYHENNAVSSFPALSPFSDAFDKFHFTKMSN